MATAPDFTSVRAATPPGKLAAFWRWWMGELANLVPERISMLGGGARAPMLAIEGDVARLIEPRGGRFGPHAALFPHASLEGCGQGGGAEAINDALL